VAAAARSEMSGAPQRAVAPAAGRPSAAPTCAHAALSLCARGECSAWSRRMLGKQPRPDTTTMVGHDCHAHLPAPGCITMSVWHAGSRKTQLGASQRGGAGRQHALAVHGGVAGAQRGPRMPAPARPALAPLAVGIRAALAAGGADAQGRRCVGVRRRDGGRVRRGHRHVRGGCRRHGRRGGRRHGGGRWRPDRLGRSRGDAAAGHAAELKALWHLHTSSRGVRQHGRGLARVGLQCLGCMAGRPGAAPHPTRCWRDCRTPPRSSERRVS